MFIVRKLKHRPWPVVVKLQSTNEHGEIVVTEHRFVAHFSAFTEAEYKAILDELTAADATPAQDLPIADLLERNVALFSRLIVGWGNEVRDEAGQPLPYNIDQLRQLVTGPDGMAISAAINVALAEIRFGAASAKNSPTSAAPGQEPVAAGVATNSPTISQPSA